MADDDAPTANGREHAPTITAAIARVSDTLAAARIPLGQHPAVEEHIRYIGQLRRRGVLIAGGPFHGLDAVLEAREPIGLLIFRCDVLASQRITAADPAVMAGAFDIELFRWFTSRDDAIHGDGGRSAPRPATQP